MNIPREKGKTAFHSLMSGLKMPPCIFNRHSRNEMYLKKDNYRTAEF